MWKKKTTTTPPSTSNDNGNGNGNDVNDGDPTEARLLQTTLRESLTPYLPPPVIKAIQELDPRLEPYVGPEGSVNVFGSLFVAWLLYQLARTVSSSLGGSSGSGSGSGSGNKNTAIQEDDRDKDILPSNAETSRPFDGTVLLCGPSLAGKTSIFYRLLQRGGDDDGSSSSNSNSSMGTVRSIKSNTGFLENAENTTTVLRILDTPGHWGPQKLLRAVPLQDIKRLVVVVDSTQPVAPAADYLYAILKSRYSPDVLIACHKSDHPKAKNARRIKLQLRSELIRLSKLDENADANNDWEEILNAVPLCSSTVVNLKAVRDFCETGTAPSSSSKRWKREEGNNNNTIATTVLYCNIVLVLVLVLVLVTKVNEPKSADFLSIELGRVFFDRRVNEWLSKSIS